MNAVRRCVLSLALLGSVLLAFGAVAKEGDGVRARLAKPAVLRGEATLSRLAFKVGEGDWEDTGLLPDEVKVTTELRLQAK